VLWICRPRRDPGASPSHRACCSAWSSPWLVAAAVAASLVFGVYEQRRHRRIDLFAFGAAAAAVALLMLGAVAFVLSFN